MPKFDTIEAWIEVEGKRLDEFKVDVDEQKRTAQCYVPSEAGKEFSVRWTWSRDCDSGGKLIVDGRKDPSTYTNPKPGERLSWIESMILPGDTETEARLMFGEILTTDDENASLQDEDLVKALGSIELEVQMGELAEFADFREPVARGPIITLQGQTPIYERMKKAGSHQVVLREAAPATWNGYDFHPEVGEPVRFVFIYRSRDILRAQEIIPPDAKPFRPHKLLSTSATGLPIIPKREVKEDGAEEDEDERTLRALKEQAATIERRLKKRKASGGDQTVLKRLKVEEIDARTAFRPGEIIDLCND